MITDSIQPNTTLIVDWSKQFDEPEGSMIVEYDTSKIPFLIWNKVPFPRWTKTGYTSVDEIVAKQGDVIWELKNAN